MIIRDIFDLFASAKMLRVPSTAVDIISFSLNIGTGGESY